MKEIYTTADLMKFIDDDTQTKALFYNLTIKKRKRCIGVFDSDGYRIISIKYMDSYKMYLLLMNLLYILMKD